MIVGPARSIALLMIAPTSAPRSIDVSKRRRWSPHGSRRSAASSPIAARGLHQLPASATLEQVTPEIETGMTLPAIRARIQGLEASVKALKQGPSACGRHQGSRARLCAVANPAGHPWRRCR